MGSWDVWLRFPNNTDASIEEYRAMSQRFELVKDIVNSMNDLVEATKRELVTLRQRRKALEDNNEFWATELKNYLDTLISDHEWVAKDAHDDLEVLTSGHIPEGYKYNRRGRSNAAA